MIKPKLDTLPQHRFIRTVVIISAMVLATAAIFAAPPAAWWQTAESVNPNIDTITSILGTPPTWTVVDLNFRAMAPALEVLDGRPVIATQTNQTLWFGGLTEYGPGLEYTFTIRFPADMAKGAFTAFLGRKDLRAIKDPGISVHLDAGGTADHVTGDFSNTAVNKSVTRVDYALRGMNTRQLAWPESLRQQVDHDFSNLPRVSEKWLTLRVLALKDHVACYLDDRLIGTWPATDETMCGRLVVQLTGRVALATVRVRQAAAATVFQPLALNGYLNASVFEKSAVNRAALPPFDTSVVVDGVPFIFPAADARGNDHLDVGRSQPQYGEMAGYPNSAFGPFGGLWSSPFAVNPRRLQFAIPKDQYCRIHVIAAADSQPDTVPILTAQFYRICAGYPKNFSAMVPAFAKAPAGVSAFPVRLADGGRGNLYHVVIPVNAGDLDELAQLDDDMKLGNMNGIPHGAMGLELTKEVQLFRSYPDPITYSALGAGLPSSVHVYAMTLEVPAVTARFEPDALGHVWTAPEKPSYTVTLHNSVSQPRPVTLELKTVSHDGQESTVQTRNVTVAPGKDATVKFALALKRFGSHAATLTVRDGQDTWVSQRSLALLQPDTRERGNWEEGRGPILGAWSYNGGHGTASDETIIPLMAKAGFETKGGTFSDQRDEVKKIAEKYGVFTIMQFEGHAIYAVQAYTQNLANKMPPAEAEAKLLEYFQRNETKPSPITRPTVVSFFTEPGLGPITAGNWPSYWGEPEHQLTDEEQSRYDFYKAGLLGASRLIRKYWPQTKILVPHGNANFCIPFLRDPETRDAFDGVGVDSPNFERVPEMQTGQGTIHCMYQLREEWKKSGKPAAPYLAFVEGDFVPTEPGSCTLREQSDYMVRNILHYIAYGVNVLSDIAPATDACNYYGVEHYGCGVFTRLPLFCPKPAYCALATMTRHINRCNFSKPIPTGGNTVYCAQFQHYKTGKLVHIVWTVRGTRPVTITVPAGVKLQLFDDMDNPVPAPVKDGQVTFTVSASPVYIEGLTNDAMFTNLGEPDHKDSQPGAAALKLASLGDGHWIQRAERDETYENNHPLQIARAIGHMTVTPTDAPVLQAQGGKALAVHLEKQDYERVLMPWYTTLVPAQPVTIPGHATHLGLWVKAASDWGRVVYFLRDAKGERWISIGTREQWNCDDIHCRSAFNFDGWRYLTFELPANSPYDGFREAGTTWWGHFGKGNGEVALPLTLEKIAVERRTHVMVVNRPVPADPADVLLGDLFAEYATAADQGREAVRLASLREPAPKGVPDLDNPIRRLAEQGVGPAPTDVRITLPTHDNDGTKCFVHFDPVTGAKNYHVWVSTYADGRGAIELGKGWKEPGQQIRGLCAETDFHIFVVAENQAGKLSQPSAPLTIRLKDMFFQK